MRPRKPPILLLVLLLIHLTLVLYYLPPSTVFSGHPAAHRDYIFHFTNSHDSARAWSSNGRGWGYNPDHMAGYPSGLVFDVDNKALSALNALLAQIVSFPTAFFLLIWAVLLFCPILIHRAARNFGLTAGEATWSLAAVLLAWYTAPTVRWCWVTGMVSHLTSMTLGLWFLSRLARSSRGTDAIGARSVLPAALVLPVLPWIHPLVFFLVALPAVLWYVGSLRRLTGRAHLVLVAGGLAAPVLNAYWLWPLLSHGLEHKTASNQYLLGGLKSLIDDLLGRGFSATYPNLLLSRWVVLSGGLAGLVALRGRGDRRAWRWLGLLLLWCLGFAYFAVYAPGGGDLQPFRFLSVAVLLACIPFGVWLRSWIRNGHRLRTTGVLLLLLLVVALPQVVTGVAVFRPRPDHVFLGRGVADPDRILAPDADLLALYDRLRDMEPIAARIACEDSGIGGLLPYYTSRATVGGPFGFVYMREGYANVNVSWDRFGGHRITRLTRDDLAGILRDLDIGLLVGRGDDRSRERGFALLARRFPDLVREVGTEGPFRIYRSGLPPSPFHLGTGSVEAEFDRLRCRDVSSGPVVLRYHFCEVLRCVEGFPLEPCWIEGRPAPFIRVVKGEESEFTIVRIGAEFDD